LFVGYLRALGPLGICAGLFFVTLLDGVFFGVFILRTILVLLFGLVNWRDRFVAPVNTFDNLLNPAHCA
jgi:hypothetical protein